MLRVAELLVVSCVVELAMTLPMAVYFHRITIFALPVNLFILPLLLVLMPAALLTLLAALVWPPAAVSAGHVVAPFCSISESGWCASSARSLWATFRIPAPLLWQSLLFCALLAAAMVLARRGRWQRRAAWAALLLAALIAVAPRPIDHPHNALLVEAIDVGQGDSLLLITPDGKTLLVDGGGFGGGPHQAPQDFDIGEEVVSPALWARGIRHLDVVALSHAHSDHMGGLPAVLRNFHPAELWVGNNPRFAAYNALLDEASALQIRIRSLRAGDALFLGSAQIAVLAPFPDYQPGAGASQQRLAGAARGLRRNLGASGRRCRSAYRAGHARRARPPEHVAQGRPSRQHHLHAARVSGPRGARSGPSSPAACAIATAIPARRCWKNCEAAKVRTFSTDINGATCFRLDGKNTAPEPSCGKQSQQ